MDRYDYTLSNKMKVTLVPERSLPVVSARGWVKAGSALDSRRLVGDAVRKMIKRGTDMRIREQFEDELDKYGIMYDIGQSGLSAFYVEWDGMTTARYTEKLLWAVYESLHFPSFSEGEFELVRKQWEANFRIEASKPEILATEEIPRMIFGPMHPSYSISIEEASAQLKKLTTEDLRLFWGMHYIPEDSGIVLVGDFDPDEMYDLVRNVFEKWDRPTQHHHATDRGFDISDYAEDQSYEERTMFVPNKANATLAIGQGIDMPSLKHSDFPALSLAVGALGGTPHGRLFQHVREGCGLSYNAGATLEEMHTTPGYFMATVQVNPENMTRAHEETWRVIAEFCKNGITHEELEQEKAVYKGRNAFLLSDIKGMAQNLAGKNITGQDIDDFGELISGLTVEEVNTAIHKHLNLSKMKVVRAGTLQ